MCTDRPRYTSGIFLFIFYFLNLVNVIYTTKNDYIFPPDSVCNKNQRLFRFVTLPLLFIYYRCKHIPLKLLIYIETPLHNHNFYSLVSTSKTFSQLPVLYCFKLQDAVIYELWKMWKEVDVTQFLALSYNGRGNTRENFKLRLELR